MVLELIDPPGTGRRSRGYRAYLQPNRFGGVDVVREWGRRGSIHRPRRLVTEHVDEAQARALLDKVIRRRLGRGYLVISAH